MDAVDRCLLQGERWFLDEMGLLWCLSSWDNHVPKLFDGFACSGNWLCGSNVHQSHYIPIMADELDHARARAVLTMYYLDFVGQSKR